MRGNPTAIIMLDDVEDQPMTASYWPSISDLFMTLFIIALALVGTIYYLLTPKQKPGTAQSIVEAVGMEMKTVREPVNKMRRALEPPAHVMLRATQSPGEIIAGLDATADEVVTRVHDHWRDLYETEKTRGEETKREVARLQKALNDKPPIIDLEDARSLTFIKGKAEISPGFRAQLNNKEFEELIRILNSYNSVDTIEIIGHTDASPVGTSSNLDSGLVGVLSGRGRAASLTAGSNADLGLMRAFAVKEEWVRWLAERRIRLSRRIDVRCYSAAQGVPPNDIAGTLEEREAKARRIEIRFTQLSSTPK